MVLGIVIATQGTFSDVAIPAKTVDVLEWLRKKLKSPGLQFQGKLVTEDVSYAVFATPADEGDTQHILPPPFSEDSFQGQIVLLKTRSENADEYDKPATLYEDLRASEYEAYYASVAFEAQDDDDIVAEDDEDAEPAVEDEEEPEEDPLESREAPVAHILHASNVFIDHPLRTRIRERFGSEDVEVAILNRCIADARTWLIDID